MRKIITSGRTSIKCILTVIFPIIAVVLCNAQNSSGYLQLVDEADKAIKDCNWEKADSCLTTAIESEPDNPSSILLMSNLGMIRFYAGNDSMALVTLDRAVNSAPASVAVLANRARVLTATGHTAEAIRDYNTIEHLDSTYTAPYLYRGMIYLYMGAMDEAKKNFEKLRELDDKSLDACVALANYYTFTEQPEEAIPYYKKLIDNSPEAAYYAGRARCQLQRDALLDASEDIASGIELDPDYAELYICRAILNKKRYRMDDALTDGNHAIQLGADKNYVYRLLGIEE